MKRIIILIICLLIFGSTLSAQTETHDITTFTPPAGWDKKSQNGVAMYSHATEQGYSLIAVYRSKASSGSVETDFQNEWQEIAVKSFNVTAPPNKEQAQDNDGWKALSGSASFADKSGTVAAMLTTVSGFGKTVSILIVLNNQAYMPLIEKFLGSLKFTKPAFNDSSLPTTSSPTQINPTNSGGSSGITNSTTSFNDGWTSTIHDEYVLVRKDGANVYLFYSQKIPADAPKNNLITEYYWQKMVAPRYGITSAVDFTPTVPDGTSQSLYYMEGSGADKKTGQSRYIGMHVLGGGGSARIVIGTASDKQSFQTHFPNPEALRNMINANRFAISHADVIGNWKDGFYGDVTYYNTYTGANAGTISSAGANEFTFLANNSYQRREVGANNSLGQNYDQRTAGKFSVSNWEVAITDAKGATTVFTAYFEAVKSGRILHLTNKQFSGNQIHLGRAK